MKYIIPECEFYLLETQIMLAASPEVGGSDLGDGWTSEEDW